MRTPFVSAIFWVLAVSPVLANPIDLSFRESAIYATSYSYILIAVVCIAIEVSLLRIICQALHKVDCDPSMIFSLAVANVLTLLLILFPIYRFTGSVILAEIAVVLVEASVIRKIFSGGGAFLDFRRALIYAGFLNLITYWIGLVTQ